MNITPCFICEKELGAAFGHKQDDSYREPAYGTMFRAIGNYGSTIFDNIGSDYLEINICDECLFNRRNKTKLIVVKRPQEIVTEWIIDDIPGENTGTTQS